MAPGAAGAARVAAEVEAAIGKDGLLKAPENPLYCPFTQRIMLDPVVLADGHTYTATTLTRARARTLIPPPDHWPSPPLARSPGTSASRRRSTSRSSAPRRARARSSQARRCCPISWRASCASARCSSSSELCRVCPLAITLTGVVVDDMGVGRALFQCVRAMQRLRVRGVVRRVTCYCCCCLMLGLMDLRDVDPSLLSTNKNVSAECPPRGRVARSRQDLPLVVATERRRSLSAMHKLFAWKVSKVAAREYAFGSSSIQGRRPSQEDRALGCSSVVKDPLLATSATSSAPAPPEGRAWRLWAARHSQEEAGPLDAQPLPPRWPISPPVSMQVPSYTQGGEGRQS